MNSFDAWDTLIARRTMRDEIYWQMREGKTFEQATEFELSNLIPIAENVAKFSMNDFVISDYGDGSPQWTLFLLEGLRTVGIPLKGRDIYVTPGGKYDGTVWATLPSKPTLHRGDNQYADVDSPQRHGIRGELVVRSPMTNQEAFVQDHGFPQLAKLMRETRLSTWDDNPRLRQIQIMQAEYNFSVLFCASIMLNRSHPTGTLLMSGRDCYMWQRLMQRMFGRGVYWETSCKLRMNANEAYHRYIQSFSDPVLVDLSGTGGSFSHLPQYPSILMFKPLRENAKNNIPALFQLEDVWRLEQANRAPLKKCIGWNDSGAVYLDSGIDLTSEPHIKAQCDTFFKAIDLMKHYDFSEEMKAKDESCRIVMAEMLPRYIDFKDAVEPLRLIDIAEDKL